MAVEVRGDWQKERVSLQEVNTVCLGMVRGGAPVSNSKPKTKKATNTPASSTVSRRHRHCQFAAPLLRWPFSKSLKVQYRTQLLAFSKADERIV